MGSHEVVKEVKKKKRSSVLELGKKLESIIIPMSPETVPGGIRMFPSPATTPVNETPPPFSKPSSAPSTPARSTPTQAVEEIETPRIHKLEIIEVKPTPLSRERQSSQPSLSTPFHSTLL